MAATIPTTIPAQLTAGDTWQWKITLFDFPASEGWTLSYAFRRRGGPELIGLTSAASGADHLVNTSAAATADFTAGDYEGQGYVTKDTERYRVWSGLLTVLPNLALSEGAETRTIARRILDSLETAILKVSQAQAAGNSGGLVEWQAEGLRIKRSSPEALLMELTKQRDRYAAICAAEDAKARLQSGRATGRRILVQF